MPRKVKYAVLFAFGLNGILILTAQYRLSYDAYNHMFFADHYLKDWWSLWETRWYTGFSVTSYPPLVHQLNALLGHLVGVDGGYALLLWATVTAYPLAVYLFSRVFTGRAAASYAALGAALLPSLFLSAHVFGQLPSLVSTLFVLLGAAVLADFLRSGHILNGALAVSIFATAAAAHHATLLFQPWLAGAVLLFLFLQYRQGRRQLVLRFAGFAFFTGIASLLVIWPFWSWGSQQALQTPIDHVSRHNFFADPFALVLFFLPVYGLLIPLIPLGLWVGTHKHYWGLGVAFLFLFILGLGGTTPLPHLFFGAGWTWLTYDRFSFWASIFLLPLLGVGIVWLRRYSIARRSQPYFLAAMGITAVIIGFIPSWLPTQPRPVAMQPIVDYLAQPGHGQYRYITLGFGDQLAYLSRLTKATTIDGSYHTARSLPELRSSGIGQIDTVFWIPGGMAAVKPILQKSGERGVRWGFVNLKFYDPLLQQVGWVKRATLSNGVEVWENPSAVLPPAVQPPAESPIAIFSWGTFPLLALYFTLALALRCYWSPGSLRILSGVQAFAIGLLPLGVSLWYYRTLFVVEHPRIYFTYSDALFFLSDGLALIAVLAWLISRFPPPKIKIAPRKPISVFKIFSQPDGWLLALCLLASLSVLWSLDWRTSVYICLQLWLCFGLYLLLRETPRALVWFSLGCCAALLIQLIVGAGEFISQSTALAAPLRLEWPGNLQPTLRGASVVQLADGVRWLRAYGTFPHPNLLGGFALALLAAPLALFLSFQKRLLLPAFFFSVGVVLIVLSFSRSAWLGLGFLGAGLFATWKTVKHRNLLLIGLAGLGTLAVLVISLKPLIFIRLGEAQVQTEQVSNYTRLWLVQRTFELIHEHPLLGTGIGSYSLALSRHVAAFYQIEPVHDLPLLVASELGIGGVILLGGLVAVTSLTALRVHTAVSIVLSVALLGLGMVALFDHYLWTLAPGRLLLATMLGLWAGQVKADGYRG